MNHAVNVTKANGFTATATAIGGRNGHTETSDGVGQGRPVGAQGDGRPGKPGTATPEHLFAAGYAACFGGSSTSWQAEEARRIEGEDHLRRDDRPRKGGGFGLAVKRRVEDKSLAQAELAAFVQEAHEKVCPYSHATRGNVDVTFDVIGGETIKR